MEEKGMEKCPRCRGQAESFVLMCGPKRPGGEEIGCRATVLACDFC